MDITSQLPFAIATSTTLLAAALDRWKSRLYDVMTIPLLVAGLSYHALTEGPSGLAASLLGALIGAGILLAFYIIGEVAASEIKLMSAVGAWLGLPFICYAFAAGAMASGAYALGLMVRDLAAGEALGGLADGRIAWPEAGMAPGDRPRPGHRFRLPVHRVDLIAVMVALGLSATVAWSLGVAGSSWSIPLTCPAPGWPVSPAASMDGPRDFPVKSAMTPRIADYRHPFNRRRNT